MVVDDGSTDDTLTMLAGMVTPIRSAAAVLIERLMIAPFSTATWLAAPALRTRASILPV